MDPFSEFTNNLYKYLTKCEKNPPSSRIIKKIRKNLDKYGDLCCPLKICSWKSHVKLNNLQILNSEEVETLIENSCKWNFEVAKVELNSKKDSVTFRLNKIKLIEKTFRNVLTQNDSYGNLRLGSAKSFCVRKKFKDLDKTNTLTELRVKFLEDITENLLKSVGFTDGDNNAQITFIVRDRNQIDDSDIKVICGSVIDVENGSKATKITIDQFYNKREMDMRLIAEHKYGVRVTSMPTWSQLFKVLGHAAVTIELLQIKPSNNVRINLSNPTDSNNKGTPFILYNCARISAILTKFEEMITEHQLTLPPIEQLDFMLLNQPEEWELVYSFIMYYPTVVKSCIYDIENGNVNLQYMCSFLFELCSKFSVYYRRVRIVTQPRPHLLPTMYARIYLLRNLQTVMHNSLRLLNIEPILQM